MAATEAEDQQARAAAADESMAGSITSDEDVAADSEEAHNIKKIMDTKVDGGSKSAWAMTLETFGMSDGKKKKSDLLCDTFDEALEHFQEMTKDMEFATTPFEDFNATKEDLLKAFVHWSRKGEEDDTRYNPSKAFRRLEAYVDWMNKNCQGMNLKGSSMKEVADHWKMKITHDKDGRLIWWIDIGGIDLQYVKKNVSHDDTLRYFVWLSHLLLFDQGSGRGFVFVEAIGNKGMMEVMTAVSMDVGTKLDRLTIGILPVKMEACYLFNNPTWMRIIMAIMAPFMGKKMRKRIVTLSPKTKPQEFFEAIVGKECIPKGIAQLEGAIEKDFIAETLERLCGVGVVTDEVET